MQGLIIVLFFLRQPVYDVLIKVTHKVTHKNSIKILWVKKINNELQYLLN